MDKKLSDNEIVKALDNDCLCVVYGVDCESCPLREKDCKILPEAIKDLIHRLQAENDRLNDMKFTQEHCDLYKENEWLKDEIKRELADHEEFVKRANEEIESLKSKSSFKNSWKNKFFKAQEEIERLTEELKYYRGELQ